MIIVETGKDVTPVMSCAKESELKHWTPSMTVFEVDEFTALDYNK